MRPRTRLDPVVKLEENRETRSLQDLADANRQVVAAIEALSTARRQAERDERRIGDAADWQLAESAHSRALADVATAERSASTATQAAGASRSRYLAVHAKAEALRRLQEHRQDDARQSLDNSERRESDELFLLRRGRGNAA